MDRYAISIFDKFFNQVFTGIFACNTKKEAITQSKETYALELDTEIKEIKVIDVVKLNDNEIVNKELLEKYRNKAIQRIGGLK